MIKGITVIHPIASSEAFATLSTLLLSLGFEAGKGWQDATGQGAAFLAPLGNLELVTGRAPAVPELLIETTQLDHIHAAVHQWMLTSHRTEDISDLLSQPEVTHWNSRLFSVKLDRHDSLEHGDYGPSAAGFAGRAPSQWGGEEGYPDRPRSGGVGGSVCRSYAGGVKEV
jgi:hypothetical protein